MTDAVLFRIKLFFGLGVLGVLTTLFVFGILLRDQETAFLGGTTRFVSSLGYSLQYALGMNGQLAGIGSASIVEAEPPDASARALPVLLYHGIAPRSDEFSLTEQTFAEQLFALKRAGYETITVEELLAYLRSEQELPDRSFLLTFDDGRRDSYERADPILAALGYTAVMFVATDASIDAPSNRTSYYLHPYELVRMKDSGRWEIASHARQVGGGVVVIDAEGTTENFLSNRKWFPAEERLETAEEYAARVEDELLGARTSIEWLLPGSPQVFSYPFGDFGQQTVNEPEAVGVIRSIVSSGYDSAFKQVWSLDSEYTMNYRGDDVFVLRRIEVGTDWSGKQLLAFLRNASPKSLPYEETFASVGSWKYNWGTLEVADGALTLAASNTSTGGLIFLDGTRDWTDYRYEVQMERKPGTAVSLIARYQNEETMALCTLEGDALRLTERVNGVGETIDEGTAEVGDAVTLGMHVVGTTVECLADDAVVARGDIGDLLDVGGIGLRVWDEPIASASATVTSLLVREAL